MARLLPQSRLSQKQKRRAGLGFERLMALLALLNLGLVLFDLSYIPWRNFYLKQFPALTQWYGEQIKGIEPHRLTVTYTDAAQALEAQVALTGLQSAEVAQQLTRLQALSVELVDENPFEAVGKSGTLERIKNRMRQRVGVESSKAAFQTFWSQGYLNQAGWEPSIQFFQAEIQPLLATNYYRRIGENGKFIDRFWRIDLWFGAIFAVEFLARTFYLSRRYRRATWLDAVIWRSYDLLLLLPFWRWLRIIPVTIRLDQARLINLQPINYRIVRALIASVAVELTEMVVVRLIEQLQELIRRGEVKRWLVQSNRYVDLNGINEVEAIAGRLTHLLVYDVLPQVRPQLEALLQHSITQVLGSSPVYAGLQRLPGASALSNQLTQQLVTDLSGTAYQAIQRALEDATGTSLMQQLVARFSQSFGDALQQDHTLDEIQSLTVALLDEIKLNYVDRLAAEELESLKAQSKRIYEITQRPNQ